MNALLAIVFSITGAIIALAAATLLLWTRTPVKSSRRVLAGVAIFYCAASTYYVPHLVANAWTAGYHPFQRGDVPPGPVVIVVLGSGVEVVSGWHRTIDRLTPLGIGRMLEAYRVYQLVDASATIISTGGHSPTDDPGPPSSETMRNTLIAMGVPADRILQESASRTTHDEARFVVPLLRRAKLSTVVLVTSDIHMRRSAGAFRAEGVHVTPAIAPDPLSRSSKYWFWPTEAGLEFSRLLTRELLGLPYYWLRGWWSPL